MTCEECDKMQNETTDSYYFRWNIANIEIRACPKHAKEVMDYLKESKKAQKHQVAVIKVFNSDKWIRISINDHNELYIESAKQCPQMKENGKPKIITYFHCDHCAEECNERIINPKGYFGKWGEINERT